MKSLCRAWSVLTSLYFYSLRGKMIFLSNSRRNKPRQGGGREKKRRKKRFSSSSQPRVNGFRFSTLHRRVVRRDYRLILIRIQPLGRSPAKVGERPKDGEFVYFWLFFVSRGPSFPFNREPISYRSPNEVLWRCLFICENRLSPISRVYLWWWLRTLRKETKQQVK